MASGIVLMGMVSCAPLEPILDPELATLELTVDSLRSSLREAHGTIAELRADIDQRRQAYAEIQIVRAQLEGSRREAERRLIEAHHVIDLQREELALVRAEREQMGRTKTALQSQLRQSRKPSSKVRKQAKGAVSPAAFLSQRSEQVDAEGDAQLDEVSESVNALHSVQVVPIGTRALSPEIGHESVVVQSGDTLWSLARRYQTSVLYLTAINGLLDDRIYVGQAIRVPQPSHDALEDEMVPLSIRR